MATKLQIFNMAIRKVGGTKMAADTDTNTVEGETLNDSFATVVDEVLAALNWAFARRVKSAAKTTDPNALTRDVYTPPTDSVAVWQVGEDQYCDNEDNWSFENGLIFLPDGGPDPIYVRYTQRIVDPTKFSPMFVTTLVSRFVVELVIPVTQNRNLHADFWKVYEGYLDHARRIEGLQGKNDKINQGSLVKVRRQ